MKDVPINSILPVSLRVGDWFWILGLLSATANQGDNRALDSLYDQIMTATE